MSLNQSVIRPQVALKVWKLKLQNRKSASEKVGQAEDDESSGHQEGAQEWLNFLGWMTLLRIMCTYSVWT